MLKQFEMPAELLKLRADDPTVRRWAHCTNTHCDRDLKVSGSVALLGYPDDLGVRANGGRPGAAAAPGFFREAFYRMSATRDLKICDLGDLPSSVRDLQNSHADARKLLQQLRPQNCLLVTIGGGHDWAAVDFDVPTMQILHLDAHLDVRAYERDQPHSGMPFRYLAEQGAKIWCLGAQPEHNAPEHWAFAQSRFQGLWSLDELEKDFAGILRHVLSEIAPGVPLGLSLDLDAFAQSISPGVSAPSPRGIRLDHVVALVDAVAKDISHVGFYELNPQFDRDGQSARLAGYLLSRIIRERFTDGGRC